MYNNNYGNYNNSNYNNNNANNNNGYNQQVPSSPASRQTFSEYSSWQTANNNNNWNNNQSPQQQSSWNATPSSPRVTPPPMNGMGMGMGGMGMNMNTNMTMPMPPMDINNMPMPVRKQWSDPSQYSSQPPSIAKPASSTFDLDVNSANFNLKSSTRNLNPSSLPMTSLAYRTAAFSQPAVPGTRGDTQFDGVAPETFNNNGMQNVFGGAGMYKSGDYVDHGSANTQYFRDAILGVNDGLVSILLLTIGLSGGGLTNTQILLAGITGAMAGAISMALGEYIATKSQSQVTQSELKLEKEHLTYHREKELVEVRAFMQELNLEGELLDKCVSAINERDEAMIRLMMSFEFGFQEELERSPIKAMLTSGALFITGALPAILPYALTNNPNTSIGVSVALSVVALFGIGSVKTLFTKGPWLYDGTENLILGAIGGAITFGLGKAYGTGQKTVV